MTGRGSGISATGFLVPLAVCWSVAMAQDRATSRRVEGRQQATGTEVVTNQVDPSVLPRVTIFALVSRNGVPRWRLAPGLESAHAPSSSKTSTGMC